MTLSGPMKTASYMLRLNPDEKAVLERKAVEQHITLSHALREGAKLYLAELEAFNATRSAARRKAVQ